MRTIDRATAYAEAVLSGELIAGPHVRNACRRHLDDLESCHARGLVYSPERATRAIRFFEERLRLSEGQFEGRAFRLAPAQDFIVGSLFGWLRADGTRRFRRAYIEQGKGNGKALAVDTPIPTPTGWTTMGALREGDQVFDESGRICEVIQAHPVSTDRICYEVEFDDGESITASAEHLWRTSHRRPKPGSQTIKTTAEIAASLRNKNGQYQTANHSVELSAALKLPAANLPVPPYTLGAWLGDGDSNCARVTCAFSDKEIVEEIVSEGVPVRAQRQHSESTGRFSLSAGRGKRGETIQELLREMGVFGNKHIPSIYLRASEAQRLALAQGLMDTDGHISIAGQCEFTNTNKRLAQDVLELLLSLGIKATMTTGKAVLDGIEISEKFRISFYPPWDCSPFRLRRKMARHQSRHDRHRLSGERRIVGCRPVPAVPVRCITVNSASSMFLCGRAMVPTHNSPLAGGIGLYGLMADKEAGAEVYSAGATKDQAAILFRDAVKMVRKSPALAERIKMSGGEGNEYNMAYLAKGSFFRPVSRETKRTGSGPRPHFALVDELHEHQDGGIVEMLERGFKFRRQPLLLMITNSGTDRNSICWGEHEHAVKVAAGNREASDTDPAYVGEIIDDSTFAYVCALDPGDDPLKNPSCWIKANPLLGVTITEEYLAGVVAQAQSIPAKLNGILRLHFCTWTDAEAAWMTRALLEPCLADFEPRKLHHGKRAAIGIDLSGTQDLTVTAYAVETGKVDVPVVVNEETILVTKPTYDCWIEAWTPEDTLAARAMRDKADYETWRDRGHLLTTPGRIVDFRHVAARLADSSTWLDIGVVAYDRYAYQRFENECNELGLTLFHAEHPQGGKKKGAPLVEKNGKNDAEVEASRLWMPSSVKVVEEAILERRVRFLRNPVLVSAFMSAVTEQDPWDNYWLAKRKSVNRIDAAVSACMAIGACAAMPVAKEYEIFFV